jgi:hypothetical protein
MVSGTRLEDRIVSRDRALVGGRIRAEPMSTTRLASGMMFVII